MAGTLLTKATLGGVEITKVQALAPTFTCMIYGDAGAGKTLLAATTDDVAAMRKVILIDVEAGTKTLRTRYPNVEVVKVRTWEEIQAVYNDLYDGTHDYQTVIVDSLTEIQYVNMAWIMGENFNLDDTEKEGWDEYRKSLKTMRRFVRAFRDLPINTIFTGLAGQKQDQKSKKTIIGPQFSGQFRQEVAGLLDEVYYLYVKELEEGDQPGVEAGSHRILLTTKTETIVAKSRSDLPQLIIDPNFTGLYPQLTQEKTS
jgi:hypothetical protein